MSKRKEDYMCVFKQTGEKLKLPGYIYQKSFDEIKGSCEAKYGGKGKYIRKNDWINPDDKYGCYKIDFDWYGNPIKDTYGNFKKVLDSDKVNVKFHTKSECTKNKNISSYMVNEPKKPILKLDNYPSVTQDNKSRSNLVIYVYIIFILVYLIWNLKFAVTRPYYLYDYIESSVIVRIFLVIITFGIIFITFCPFESCWLPRFASKYRKDPLNEIFRDYCKYYKKKNGTDHIGCTPSYNVCTKYKNKFPGCSDDPNFKYEIEASDINKTCQDYGLPKDCYFYYKDKKRYGYYYPNKYMNWVEEYDRRDYQLKDKIKDDNPDIKNIIKENKELKNQDIKNIIKENKDQDVKKIIKENK
jgi:hypothetical protein